MPQSGDQRHPVGRYGSRYAFRHFAEFAGPTQSQKHIKPLHEYVTCRLVLEGGFRPAELEPRPPLRLDEDEDPPILIYDAAQATRSEATILGGLKTKNVDIVVTKDGIGPVLAVSCKGMTGAIRNLTNRLEETIGECTNIHTGYPALVFGYLFLMRANRPGKSVPRSDVAIDGDGRPVEGLKRFHHALSDMTGRLGVRNDASRYEAIAMAIIEVGGRRRGQLLADFPPADSPIGFERFFTTLYARYDERYVVGAPLLARRTRRREWSSDSPALVPEALRGLDYRVRTGD